jgi:hypothetical protein
MASKSFHLYTLEPGAEFHDLSAFDFADIFWQAFDVDKLESITIEATRAKDRISIRILNMKHKRRKKRSK